MKKFDYTVLDQSQISQRLFHPRKEVFGRPGDPQRDDILIDIGDGVKIGASFHFHQPDSPSILFFHGNGEIVADYDDLGKFFTRAGLNLFVADYRGYGRSSGRPGVSAMMTDCHKIFDYFLTYREEKNLTGSLVIMGRSLGSASAIQIAANSEHCIDALIIESGFARISPLLKLLGIDPDSMGFIENQEFENVNQIKSFSKQLLIIHAQFDHIIPFSEGVALYESCGSNHKFLLEIKGANHNDIFFRGLEPYMEQVKKICFAKTP